MKRCPKGVICIENISIIVILLLLIIIVYLMYVNVINKQNIKITNQTSDKVVIKEEKSNGLYGSWFYPNYPYNNFPENVYLNPTYPPLSDERYLVPSLNYIPPGSVPINVSTNVGAVETAYRQVGILTPFNNTSKDNILPLMGKPLFIRRSLWNYYTISNQHNNVKLPITVKGRSGLNDNGVEQLYSGDRVYIEGANEVYKVTIYESSTIKYIPFI